MSVLDVTLQDIYKARRRIASIAQRTPLIRSPVLTDLVGASVHLKLESVQQTGAFKIRGATNKMLRSRPKTTSYFYN
jgi:threonine dehydratase